MSLMDSITLLTYNLYSAETIRTKNVHGAIDLNLQNPPSFVVIFKLIGLAILGQKKTALRRLQTCSDLTASRMS